MRSVIFLVLLACGGATTAITSPPPTAEEQINPVPLPPAEVPTTPTPTPTPPPTPTPLAPKATCDGLRALEPRGKMKPASSGDVTAVIDAKSITIEYTTTNDPCAWRAQGISPNKEGFSGFSVPITAPGTFTGIVSGYGGSNAASCGDQLGHGASSARADDATVTITGVTATMVTGWLEYKHADVPREEFEAPICPTTDVIPTACCEM